MTKNSIKVVSKESLDIPEEKMVELYNLFPEVFSEGKIDFDKLKETLGEEIDNRDEKYSFNWSGRKEALKNIQTTAKGTLIPEKKESVKFDSTENLFLEGDNLEVLKLLQKSYFNKVKMIYIDPPYNTGKDFVYKDDFKNSIKAYLEQTGQVNGDGIKLTSNPETSGRFHSDWITMMYPRLFIARNLLREDGVIFVSIDDNEVHNLRMIMNEIFGEENFVGTITWEKRTKSQNTETARDLFQSKTEYILIYKKSVDKLRFNLSKSGEKFYDLNDEKGNYRLKVVEEMSALGMRGRQTMIYAIKGITPRSGKQWKWGKDIIKKFEDRGDIEIIEKKVYIRMRPQDESADKYMPFWSHFFDKEVYGTAETGKAELSDRLGTKAHGFETVKPVKLIKKLLFHLSKNDFFKLENCDIILDFFAGSGTTAEAVIQLNKEDNSKRKFILVQLPEITDKDSETYKAGFKNIAELSKERIRKAIKLIESEEGFKVFKLSQSNYKIWEKYEGKDEKELKKQLELFKTPLVSGYKEENVIYECIIKEGYSLNSKIEKVDIKPNKIYKVLDNNSYFYICLDSEIKDKTLEELKLKKEDMLICFDEGLSDSKKKNLSIQCNLKVI